MENPSRTLISNIRISDSMNDESKALLPEPKQLEKAFNVKLHKKFNTDRDIGTHRSEELKISGSDTVGYSDAAQISDPVSLDFIESSERDQKSRDLKSGQESNRKKFSIKRATEEPAVPQDSNLNIETGIKPRSRSSTIHQNKGRERTGDLGAGRHHVSEGGPHIGAAPFNVRFDESEIQRSHPPKFESTESRDELNIEIVDEDYVPSTITDITEINVQNPVFSQPFTNKSTEKKSLETNNATLIIEEESVCDYKANFLKCVPLGSEKRYKICKSTWLCFCKKTEIEIRSEGYNTLIWLSQKELDPSDEIQVKIYNSLLREIPHELIGFPQTLTEWRESFMSDSLINDPTKGLLLVLLELLFLKQKRMDVYGKFETLSLDEKKIFAILPATTKNIVVEYLHNWKFYQILIAGKPSNLFFTFYTNIINYYWYSLKKKGRSGQQITKKIHIKLKKNINEFFSKN
ncbi:unnamed protein product [Blepharisma stoltei]|uniref:Uncharacterized protein n=1 Tax=Blepharisma stoltei TaxID=1481888 RepID=A0AAU9K0Y5_9CILI|nr:unnamed protein product [Blepharisma stoltei]